MTQMTHVPSLATEMKVEKPTRRSPQQEAETSSSASSASSASWSDLPDLADLIRWFALPRPAWQADALCKEYPDVPWFPRRGEDRRPALAVCGRCLVLNECRQWALHDPHAPSHGIVGGLSEQARRNARRARRARTIPTTETEHS